MKECYAKKLKKGMMYSKFRKEERSVSGSEEEKLMKKKEDKGGIIICELQVGEHLTRIRGLDNLTSAYDYEVLEEHPYHYVIGIKYIAGFISDRPQFICTSVSKASIYCGDVVLIKEDGTKVRAYCGFQRASRQMKAV